VDLNYILLWITCVSLGLLLIRLKQRPLNQSQGWLMLIVGLLLLAGLLLSVAPTIAGVVVGSLWLVTIVLPSLLVAQVYRLANRGRYQQAARLSALVRWLHPADGWWQQPKLFRALHLGQQGNMDDAIVLLSRCQASATPIARVSTLLLYRMNAKWIPLLEWLQEQGSEATLLRDAELATYYLRALGETGDLNGLLQGIAQAEPHLERSGDLPNLNLLRLFAFAFCGQPEQLRQLLDGALSTYVGTVRQFWLATAELAAGNHSVAYAQLQLLSSDSDYTLTRAVNWRLSQPIHDPQRILTESSWQILAHLGTEFRHEARYSGKGLHHRQPIVTYGLIALNCLVFALEIVMGGSENTVTLYHLGALVPELVWQGSWWRLLAANFLHFGALHLVMNMLGLYVLGRYVETTLGRPRFLMCYFTSGIGAMLVFTLLTVFAGYETRIVVGASGAIMGLVGVMGAIFLYGWQREKSRFAAQKFRLVLLTIGLQVVFDLSTPQVSFVGHTAGLIIGAIVGAVMMYTTKPATPDVIPQ